MKKNKNNRHKMAWTQADKFAFATQKLRATSIPGRRQDGPAADEWDDEADEWDE